MNRTFTLADLEALIDRCGSDPHDWPRGTADSVNALVARDDRARRLLETARALDADLGAIAAPAATDAALVGRVLQTVRERQRGDMTSLATLFTPVRMAAFAGAAVGCIALGATLGLVIDQTATQSYSQGEEVALLVLGVGEDGTGFGEGDSL